MNRSKQFGVVETQQSQKPTRTEPGGNNIPSFETLTVTILSLLKFGGWHSIVDSLINFALAKVSPKTQLRLGELIKPSPERRIRPSFLKQTCLGSAAFTNGNSRTGETSGTRGLLVLLICGRTGTVGKTTTREGAGDGNDVGSGVKLAESETIGVGKTLGKGVSVAETLGTIKGRGV